MISIQPYAASSWGSASSLAGITAASAIEGSGRVAATGETASSVSPLARQLSEAAARAAVRDASLSPAQLAAKARSLEEALCTYNNTGAYKHSTDKPQTDDPKLVARAQQASDYIHRRGANPFAGLSRDQLVLIMYDEGDAFTTDERFAALEEYSNQRCLWSQKISTLAWAEKQANGNYINSFKAAIAEYQAGSPIERATYPENYAALRQRWIDYWEEGKGSGDMARDFFDVMLRPLPTPQKYDESLSWGLASILSSAGPERTGY
jgi:hypothetical protein